MNACIHLATAVRVKYLAACCEVFDLYDTTFYDIMYSNNLWELAFVTMPLSLERKYGRLETVIGMMKGEGI